MTLDELQSIVAKELKINDEQPQLLCLVEWKNMKNHFLSILE